MALPPPRGGPVPPTQLHREEWERAAVTPQEGILGGRGAGLSWTSLLPTGHCPISPKGKESALGALSVPQDVPCSQPPLPWSSQDPRCAAPGHSGGFPQWAAWGVLSSVLEFGLSPGPLTGQGLWGQRYAQHDHTGQA